jgi:hypothetical protein
MWFPSVAGEKRGGDPLHPHPGKYAYYWRLDQYFLFYAFKAKTEAVSGTEITAGKVSGRRLRWSTTSGTKKKVLKTL